MLPGVLVSAIEDPEFEPGAKWVLRRLHVSPDILTLRVQTTKP